MMTLADQFRFEVVTPAGARAVTPLFSDLLFSDEADGKVDTRRVLASSLTFAGDDFDYFNAQRLADGLCWKQPLRILQGDTLRLTVTLTTTAGDWTTRDGVVTFDPVPVPANDCLESKLDTEVNALDLGTAPVLNVLVGELSEAVTCTFEGELRGRDPIIIPSDCLPDAAGWTLVRRFTEVTTDTSIANRGRRQVVDEATYQREEFRGSPPAGGGWVNLGGGLHVRELYTRVGTREDVTEFPFGPRSSTTIRRTTVDYDVLGGRIDQLPDNGVFLRDVITGLVQDCGLAIRSNFLDINPDGIAPDNRAYVAAADYQNIVLLQKTDVLNADATENATRAPVRLKEVFEFLEGLNVFPRVRGTELQVEHLSYYESNGADFSGHPDIVGATDFTYREEDMPFRERWGWMDNFEHLDFDGDPITYDAECARGEGRQFTASKFSTNYLDMQNRPDRYSSEGFAAVATFKIDDNYNIIIKNGINTGQPLLNQPLAWSTIQDQLLRHGRPLPEGVMNGQLVTFDSSEPQKEQQELRIYLSHEDYWNFDASRRVKSQFGWGKVVSSQYSAKNAVLTLKLRHDE